MRTHESAFHALYPAELADRLCKVADLGIEMSKGMKGDDVALMQVATMRAIAKTKRKWKWYKVMRELVND